MPRKRRKQKSDKPLTASRQARAVIGVAMLTFKTAPGAVFFKLLGSIIGAVMPFAVAYFAAATTTALADAYGGSEAAGRQAIIYVIITAALGFFMTIWRSIDQYVQAKMRYVVEARVNDAMYEQFLGLSFAQYDDKQTADVYDKAQRFANFFAYVFDRIASLITEFITMIVGVAALVMVNMWLALVVLAAIVPGVYVQFRLSREQIAHWNKNVDLRRKQSRIEWGFLQPHAIAELRLYGVVRHLMKLRITYRELDEQKRIGFERKYLGKRLLADGLEAATELGTLIWAVMQIISRTAPIGQFVFVQQVVSRAMGGASAFVSQISSIDEDIANLFDYETFMSMPRGDVGTITIATPPETITFRDVSFSYLSRPDHQVLKAISFVIPRGKHIAIVGENGAGKSTLIKLLTGLYHPTKGAVYVDDKNLRDVDAGSWHRNLSVLQQSAIQYDFTTAGENVRFGDVDKKTSPTLIDQALKQAEAYDFVHELPKGIDNLVDQWMEDEDGDKGTDLSGGQWQRLALARNFYRDAPIIILDEPTSAIDALAESKIFKRLFADREKTIITISHRLSTVRMADIIYMLEDGAIVESGTHRELVAKKGRYYRMFASQLTNNQQK